jgi:hypothetical protein
MIIKTNIETEKGIHIVDATSFKLSENIDIFIYAFPFEFEDKIQIGDGNEESEGTIELIKPLDELDFIVKKLIKNSLNKINWDFSGYGQNPTIVFVIYPAIKK